MKNDIAEHGMFSFEKVSDNLGTVDIGCRIEMIQPIRKNDEGYVIRKKSIRRILLSSIVKAIRLSASRWVRRRAPGLTAVPPAVFFAILLMIAMPTILLSYANNVADILSMSKHVRLDDIRSRSRHDLIVSMRVSPKSSQILELEGVYYASEAVAVKSKVSAN